MIVTLQTQKLQTLAQVQAFVSGNEPISFTFVNRHEAYGWMTDTLRRFAYTHCKRADKGVLRQYLLKATGFSRAQVTRCIAQFRYDGRIEDRRHAPVVPFARRYTPEDIRLLVDQESLSPALRRTFMDGQYATVETTSSATIFRKFGGTGNQAKANGAFATTAQNASRSETTVFQKWSNQRFEAQIEVPEGNLLNIGQVAPQMSRSGARIYYQGGANQVLLPRNYPDTWIKSVRDGKSGTVYNLEQFRELFPDQFN